MNKLLGEWKIDHEYETYVMAWMCYHRAADHIDGTSRFPNQRMIPSCARVLAVQSGNAAMSSYLRDAGTTRPNAIDGGESWKKWQGAKSEALSRLEVRENE